MLNRAGLLALLAMAGCAGEVARIEDAAVQSQFVAAGTLPVGGILPAAVLGRPPRGLDPAAVVALLRAPGHQGTLGYRLAPSERKGWRMVLAFGQRSNATLCTDPSPGGEAGVLAAALCLDEQWVSRATLRGNTVSADALARLVATLMPGPRRSNNDSPT